MSSCTERAESEPALLVDVDGFEGPLDLLLELARRQKVDLHRISILALAEQYITFIEAARRMRLELAADYLVMAAWLAYLKSRLLLPEPPKGEEPSAEDLATALALRLRRLEAIREAAKKIGERAWLGRDVFARGAPEPVIVNRDSRYEATLYDLLKAYAQQRQIQFNARVSLHKRNVWSLVDAREALERLVGHLSDWVTLDTYLWNTWSSPPCARPLWPRPCPPPWKWCARASSRSGRTRLSLRSGSSPSPTRRRQEFKVLPDMQEDSVDTPEADEPEVSHVPDHGEAMRIAEALLFAAAAPLSVEELTGRLPEGADVEKILQDLSELYALRGVNLVRVAGQMGLPHRQRSVLRAGPRRGRAAQALPRRHGDARHHRLSPAGDPCRDRGDPRRRHLEGHARPSPGDGLGPPARPPEGAGPPRHLRHHARASWSISASMRSRTCRASRS